MHEGGERREEVRGGRCEEVRGKRWEEGMQRTGSM
jgi:hypothetical protein